MRDTSGRALEALAGCLEAKLVDHCAMSKYQPRAAHGDPSRETASPRASIDGFRNYTSGSVRKPRISPLGDKTGAWNDRNPRVLIDLLVSSMGMEVLATEAMVITTYPNEGPKSPSTTR